MSSRRSLPALNLLKQQHENRIKNYHRPRQKAAYDGGKKAKETEAEGIIGDIENYALKKYPQLKKLLVCQTNHSGLADNGNITIGFGFNSDSVVQHKAKLNGLKAEETKDLLELDSWYVQFLASCAGGEDTPVFDPKHLRAASIDNTWHSEYSL